MKVEGGGAGEGGVAGGGHETEIRNHIKAAYSQKAFLNTFPPFLSNLSLPWNDIYSLFIPHREF